MAYWRIDRAHDYFEASQVREKQSTDYVIKNEYN